MSYLYISGYVIALLLGVASLALTKDDECNADYFHCYAITIVLSIFSWFTVIAYIASEARKRMILKKDKND